MLFIHYINNLKIKQYTLLLNGEIQNWSYIMNIHKGKVKMNFIMQPFIMHWSKTEFLLETTSLLHTMLKWRNDLGSWEGTPTAPNWNPVWAFPKQSLIPDPPCAECWSTPQDAGQRCVWWFSSVVQCGKICSATIPCLHGCVVGYEPQLLSPRVTATEPTCHNYWSPRA